ncbi:MAG: hypothetical protein K6C10_01470 [Prevotella sp.]|nr:hypothetical protein [Prevotella sp.]
MKKILFLLVVATMPIAISAQTDVTSNYVVNASFEDDNASSLQVVSNQADGLRGYQLDNPTGWTVSGSDVTKLLVTANCYTDNNFGLVTTLADGQQAYYLRMGWSTGTSRIEQQIKSLKEGKYRLSANYRAAYANQASSTLAVFAGSESKSTAFTQGSQNYFATATWNTIEVVFEQSQEGNVSIGFTVDWLSGGSCVMIDHVELTQLPDDYVDPDEPVVESPTEGTITADFVDEPTMQADLLQMLANFALYMKNDFQEASSPNSIGEACGCFRGENTMGNNEQGVRPNADLSMICAFLVKYGKDKVTLPTGVTWSDIEEMAMKSLIFAYSTHKANKLKVCSGNNYWGSTSTSDYAWESSLWAMSVAYSAFFQWDLLSEKQRNYIYQMLKAECNYELNRSIPTGYQGDTKAEENGWEADILAVTLGLFPEDDLAPKWFQRLREFAINSYSHSSDRTNKTIVDPDYDTKTVAQLYKGQNLYDDYTLQNHNYFHTSYQNVVIQELGEAALALKLFQLGLHGEEKWKTNALMHHNKEVQEEVLNWLALTDGELAMPNGNDWSLFLYDQITSYSTNACFLRDADALMLENLAYKYIKARQQTTSDGSWLLRADVGARRMGVEAHRVMMTYLMHEVLSTKDLAATDFETFRQRYSAAKKIDTQNIVRAFTKDRFTTFSWSTGLKSYTGYIAANSVDKNKIIVPYRSNNTGNFLGWYQVSGKGTNATPVVSGIYDFQGDGWTMNGELNTNDGTLNNRFAIYSTPGNAVIYIDNVRANSDVTITGEKGGLMAVSMDEMTKTTRSFYHENGSSTVSDNGSKTLSTSWLNIDNELGFVGTGEKQMYFGDRSNNNSVMTSKLYSLYSGESRAVKQGDVVDRRAMIYYSNVDAEQTKTLASELISLKDKVPTGWNGAMAFDPDGTGYLLLSNFCSGEKCKVEGLNTKWGYPVLSEMGTSGAATFAVEPNHSVSNVVKFYAATEGLFCVQDEETPNAAYFESYVDGECEFTVNVVTESGVKEMKFATTGTVKLTIDGDDVIVEKAEMPSQEDDDLTEGYTEITESIVNPNFEEDETYGTRAQNVTASGITYADCYVNSVDPLNSRWPNLLPVKGWTPMRSLSSSTNYARMYSMPYSMDLFCVSPSDVGNYAAQTAGMISDDGKGDRTLTVLNSWSAGRNLITQDVDLPEGEYRLLLNMKYDCANQQSNDGKRIVATGNTNTSYTGVKFGTTTDYRYPTAANSWETLVYDFTLEEPNTVTLSLGYQSSASAGAANNTLLYIDNVRLFQKISTGIKTTNNNLATADNSIYDLQGRKLSTSRMYRGIVIKNGKKVVLK